MQNILASAFVCLISAPCFAQDSEGFEKDKVSFSVVALEWHHNDIVLSIIGEGTDLTEWEIKIVPEMYKERPEWWDIHILAKPLSKDVSKKLKADEEFLKSRPIWNHQMNLTQYHNTPDEIENILKKLPSRKGFSRTFDVYGQRIIGTKGVRVIGANRSVKIIVDGCDE